MEGAPKDSETKDGKIKDDKTNDSKPRGLKDPSGSLKPQGLTHSIITAQKKEDHIKDPRRVAAGKKLAEISKQAKAKKKAEREANENKPKLLQMSSMAAAVSIASLALTAVGVYFGYKAFRGKVTVGLTEEAPLKPRGHPGGGPRWGNITTPHHQISLMDSLDSLE